MKNKEISNFISSIENSLYNKIRQSKSDAEARRYLKEHLQQFSLNGVVKSFYCNEEIDYPSKGKCKKECIMCINERRKQ
jgi:hypothetical protein